MNSRSRKLLDVAIPLMCSIGLVLPVVASPPAAQPSVPVVATTNTPDPGHGPRIFFAEPVHDFGKTNAGSVVKASFVFKNTGDETLTVSSVTGSCGCTTAGEWTREVAPEQTGKIPVQFTSAGFGGPVAKTITVVSNDKTHPTTILQLKGTLWKAIDVVPAYAVLNVVPDAASPTSLISITNNTEQPLVLSEPEVNNKAFTAVLTTNEPGKSFRLAVTTVATNTGSVQGQITLRTSSTNMPVVNIVAWANVQPAISVIPPTINLPPGPLANRMTPIVTLINNTTNPLSFSEPTVNPQDIQMQFREVQANRYFTATLTFPQGFEMPAGKSGEFVIKSTHPKYPTLHVPINQPPRQTVAQQQQAPVIKPLTLAPSQPVPAPAVSRPLHVMPRPAGSAPTPPMPPAPTK